MQLEGYRNQAPASDEELQQLVDLFAAQQLVTTEADVVVVQESQKTLGLFREAISASKAETQVLMLENASLRERLANMVSQRSEVDAAHAAETKAKDARHTEEVAALNETNRGQQRVCDALDKIVQESIGRSKKASEVDDSDFSRSVHATLYTIQQKQYEHARHGLFIELKTMCPANSNWTLL